MIKTKEDLKEYLAADNAWYHPKSWKWQVIDAYTKPPCYLLKKYLKYLRLFEYHHNNSTGSRLHTGLGYYYERKKNQLGNRLGIEIGPNCFGKGLTIWHVGSIVVNPHVRAGENCVLRGANCIGNNGTVDKNPLLGDHVELGYGAVIIGDVTIASHTIIGANAEVNRSIEDEDNTYVGVPAKKIQRNSRNETKTV